MVRYDIHAVCEQLGTTSRALRFYEEKGLITSERAELSSRRQYTAEQVECIRHILVLRTLGLSIKTIATLQHQDTDLKEAVLHRRAEMLASIHTKTKEIARLNEALAWIERGADLLLPPLPRPETEERCVQECIQAIVEGDISLLYRHVSDKLAAYLPKDVFQTVRADTMAPLGEFTAFEAREQDAEMPTIYRQYVRYERLGLKIQLVFHGGMLDGLWLSYYETEKEKKL